ncbi:MAG: RraA family protein [Trueperaceae bacterium]
MTAITWSTDDELFPLVRDRLFSAVLGDVLDRLGYRHQFLPPDVRPLMSYGTVVGRAMPVLEADVFDDHQAFGKMFEALDDLREGDIYLASGGSRSYAFFGELMAVAASARGAHGAVLYGFHRDSDALRSGGFPVYSVGAYAQDQAVRGRVIEYRTTIEIGRATVEPGDLVVADSDGVLIVPQRIEAEVVREALAKVTIETDVRQALRSGMSISEAFVKFGVM